ncbi:fungal-specific transcription factor domain-containing protein [Cercophora newfieldiana]|uniref:Fungal-specific transcription factor domain-containing protein n=1 Tax=Cercophora newfieldiana TaxID=92897 RepID=A0AA40CLV0_9PEZI|nr:fungal-specific transcription factor domain-containing protein [Cercophora newfieldiana]
MSSKPARRSRIRIPLSCDPCRARKLKCNRERPCQNCVARHQEAGCIFQATGHIASSTKDDLSMRQRIDHLEALVKRLIADAESPPSSVESSTTDDQSVGNTVMDGARSIYIGAGGDWRGVLDEINALKLACPIVGAEELQPAPSHTVDGASLLFAQTSSASVEEILSSLPPKHELDRLVEYFFDYESFPLNLPPILHKPTFMKEYEHHWNDPSQTSLIWLALLFSILGVTMLAYHQHGETPEYTGLSESLFQLYRTRTAQCLLGGDIAKCLPYTVEALRLNATAELNRKDDNRRGLWIMTGVIIRAAINMGYHRDPAHSPSISVFQAEYRRRVWLSVISMDDMASLLGGFPRMTASIYSDAVECRNLHDWELVEGMTELPPSRPLNEVTAATYLIAKSRLFRALGCVQDLNSNPTLHSPQMVLEIDRGVQQAYDSFPEHMKVTLSDVHRGSSNNTSNDIARTKSAFSNTSLFTLYHLGIILLHRRFLSISRASDPESPQVSISQKRCLSSALSLLSLQKSFRPEFYESSFTRQLLLLAGMVLVLEMGLRDRNHVTSNRGIETSVLVAALEESVKAWRDVASQNSSQDPDSEVSRACNLLARMVNGIGIRIRTGTDVDDGAQGRPIGSGKGEINTVGLDWVPGFGLEVSSLEGAAVPASLDDGFDWAMWDAFIDESGFEGGRVY